MVSMRKVAEGGIRSWDSELLLSLATSTMAVARWTALRLAWHDAVLPQATLVWFYEDLEVNQKNAVQVTIYSKII